MSRDEMIEAAKKVDDATSELSSEDYQAVMRILQGIRESRRSTNRPAFPATPPAKV